MSWLSTTRRTRALQQTKYLVGTSLLIDGGLATRLVEPGPSR